MNWNVFRAILPLFAAALCHASTLPTGFQETIVYSGLNLPTAVRFAPDGRVFVIEKGGLLKVFDSLTDATSTVVADFRSAVYDFNDGGLLGLAIHPAFPAQPYLYVLYTLDAPIGIGTPFWNDGCPTASTTGCAVGGRLSRLTLNGNALAGPEEVLIENWCQQYAAHSIGDLAFGPDGALYVTSGEGGNAGRVDYGQGVNDCGDPVNEGGALHAQDIRSVGDPVTYAGTLLRLNPSNGSAMPDNPLVGGAVTQDDRIIAYGLRNPFRLTIHPTSGEIWIADVGWQEWEEINRVPDPNDATVENFGWPCYEGSAAQAGYDAADLPLCESLYAAGNATPPYFKQQHSGSGALSGLAFYQGGNYPSTWHGALFYTDYTKKWIRALRPTTNGLPNPVSFTAFAGSTPPIVDLQIGPGGDLFFVDIHGGTIRRITYLSGNRPPVAVAGGTPLNGPAPLTVQFTSAGSHDPDAGDTLTFSWDLDGDGMCDDANTANTSFVYTSAGDYVVTLCVSDNRGASSTAGLSVQAGNAPPTASILEPSAGLRWRVDEVIHFSGTGTDPETGLLPPAALSWELTLHHCHHDDPLDCHVHFAESFTGITQGSFVGIDHEAPAYLTLTLNATELPPANWWDVRWTERSRLRIDTSGMTGILADVPVLVKLDGARIAYARAQIDARDLRFISDAGTPLPFEIDTWMPGGVSLIWVRIPAVNPAAPENSFWMYYGNSDTVDAQDPPALWGSTHAGVWHMGPSLSDSSGHGNHGTNHGTTAAAGQLGDARIFNGLDNYVDAGLGSSLDLTNAFTLEAWIQTPNQSQSAYMRIISNREVFPQTGGYRFEYNPGLDALILNTSSGNSAQGAAALNTNWHYVVATFENAQGALYVNGAPVTSDSAIAPALPSGAPLYIGWRSGGGDAFEGGIDEVRISNVRRPAAWVSFQYRSMADQLLTYGARESFVPLSSSTSLRLDPEIADLQMASEPPGLELVVYAESGVTPFNRDMIVGARTTVVAPTPQHLGEDSLYFHSWSDGGAATHDFVMSDQSAVLTAIYLVAPPGDCNVDGFVDMEDPLHYFPCLSGPSAAGLSPGCGCADLDGDGDADMVDYSGFTVRLRHP